MSPANTLTIVRWRITADKKLRCYAPSPKLPSATSFIRKTLSEMAAKGERR